MEQEHAQPEETTQKKYIRNFTEEGREKQKIHLETIRKKAMEKKRLESAQSSRGRRHRVDWRHIQ